jgi:hypothetical protein
MELTNENENCKVCKLCNESLPLTAFRPKRNMCKCCVVKRENTARKELMRNYYYKNKEALDNERKLLHLKLHIKKE